MILKIMNDIFNFEVLPPIIIFNDYSLIKVLEEIYDMNVYPMSIIKDKNSPVFKAAEGGKTRDKVINLDYVILPIRYKTEFLA